MPKLRRIESILDFTDNNYYLFSGGGIPSIYNHVANSTADINYFNQRNKGKIDYLIVCIDTEEESRDYILEQIEKSLKEKGIDKLTFQLLVFEQKTSIETWFLGNRKVFKNNPEDETLRRYIAHYNIKEDDPELMENIDGEEFTITAQFHHSYLRKLFAEKHINYSKRRPGEVCERYYLDRIIERYRETGHISTFGRWYSFVTTELNL